MVSLSNHEAGPHRSPCEAFMVRQAHHEGYPDAARRFGLVVLPNAEDRGFDVAAP